MEGWRVEEIVRLSPEDREPDRRRRDQFLRVQFIKIQRTLRVSPAMAGGVTTCLFDVMDLVTLLIESESEKAA